MSSVPGVVNAGDSLSISVAKGTGSTMTNNPLVQKERNTEELIQLLKDQYGELTKDQIIHNIRYEGWKLLEGRGGPVDSQGPAVLSAT